MTTARGVLGGVGGVGGQWGKLTGLYLSAAPRIRDIVSHSGAGVMARPIGQRLTVAVLYFQLRDSVWRLAGKTALLFLKPLLDHPSALIPLGYHQSTRHSI